jgi:hypothetical protein
MAGFIQTVIICRELTLGKTYLSSSSLLKANSSTFSSRAKLTTTVKSLLSTTFVERRIWNIMLITSGSFQWICRRRAGTSKTPRLKKENLKLTRGRLRYNSLVLAEDVSNTTQTDTNASYMDTVRHLGV